MSLLIDISLSETGIQYGTFDSKSTALITSLYESIDFIVMILKFVAFSFVIHSIKHLAISPKQLLL